MAKTTSYGMGQYRYTRSFTYISLLGDKQDGSQNDSKISYVANGDYQDVKIELPVLTGNISSNETITPVKAIQYCSTYYVRLTLPQNPEFTNTVNLKLCAASNNDSGIDFERFQTIKRIVVPPTISDEQLSSPVLLFEDPTNTSKIIARAVYDGVMEQNEAIIPVSSIDNTRPNSDYVIRIPRDSEVTSSKVYSYYYKKNSNDKAIYITNFQDSLIIQTWKLGDESDALVYDFVFSPKYNLSGGYSYLLLETDRNNSESRSIQFSNNGKTFYGTYLEKTKIKFEIYEVLNLLSNSTNLAGQIQSGTSALTHIGVWGHPDQIMAINGEEIRIGQSGYYEIKDYAINSLGMVVLSDEDKFTIDYEYTTSNG